MRTKLFSTLAGILLAGLLATSVQASDGLLSTDTRPAKWAKPIDTHYNLYQITPTLYRSQQPDAEAEPLLHQLGVVTVVNLIKESDSQWLTDPSVTQVQIPLHTDRVDDADMIQSLRAIQTAQEKGPVLIHCKHGLDRTGLVSAMYRIVVQGWSKEAALEEMKYGGFGDEKRMENGIDYIKKVDVPQLKAALESGACSTSAFASCAIKGWFEKHT